MLGGFLVLLFIGGIIIFVIVVMIHNINVGLDIVCRPPSAPPTPPNTSRRPSPPSQQRSRSVRAGAKTFRINEYGEVFEED